ncbi:MAG: hypothetical protein AAF387_03450 [Pseudomonadota bacterium]
MKSLVTDRCISRVIRIALLAVLHFALLGGALAQSIDQVFFPKTENHLLISYSVRHDMLAENDPTPLLRIYGNGLVKVHRPYHMKLAGDYEMRLDENELQALCREFIDRNLMSFRKEDALTQVNEAINSTGRYHGASDSSHVEISFHPRAVRLTDENVIHAVGSRAHEIANPQMHARKSPTATLIKNYAALDVKLKMMLFSDRLELSKR